MSLTTKQKKAIEAAHSNFVRHLAPPDANGCEHWQASKNPVTGYGEFKIGRAIKSNAHRFAYFYATGRWPAKDIAHTCDVHAEGAEYRTCCNPDHLVEMTRKQNLRDRDKKNRNAKGERIGTSVLDDIKVNAIRHLHSAGVSQTDIARMVGVSQANISAIVLRKTWRHV